MDTDFDSGSQLSLIYLLVTNILFFNSLVDRNQVAKLVISLPIGSGQYFLLGLLNAGLQQNSFRLSKCCLVKISPALHCMALSGQSLVRLGSDTNNHVLERTIFTIRT